ncbi:MAG: hypothetical protein U9R27_07555 [Campylobacterota bacterium]|nr:hypothetical protein [Campylobacterota bacterium]
MKNELLILAIVGLLFGYFFLGYVYESEGIEDKTILGHTIVPVKGTRSEAVPIRSDALLQTENRQGESSLDLSTTYEAGQLRIWLRSSLHREYLDLFSNFSAMRDLLNDRLLGEPIKQKLLKKLDSVEDDFYSGTITPIEAKKELDQIDRF